MEMFIIILIIIAVYGVVGLIFMLVNKMKNRGTSKSVVQEKEKTLKEKTLNVLREDSIVINDKNEEVILKILEDNGDIKKIDKEIVTPDGTSIYSIEGITNVFWGDCDDGPVPGNTIIMGNNHVIIAKSKSHMLDEDDYYIDINNIKKITRKNEYCESEDEDGWSYNSATFVIYTKNNNSLELIYPDEVTIPDKNSPMVIKKAKEDIIFEYTLNMNIKGKDIKYVFDDTNLQIGESSNFDPNKAYYGRYEIVINYSDIISKDITNNESSLNVIIEAKDNYKYILVFTDDEEATKFYNELNNH